MRICFLLIGFCFWHSNVSCQCQPVLLEITSQAQIDNFATQYPGCTRVDGSLRIQGKDIVSLEGLSQIETLMGELQISNTSITNFHGLHNLDSILSDLTITNDSLITNFSGLESLQYIDRQFIIYGNSSLINLEGLHSLDRIRVRLIVEENAVLQNFAGLSNLGYIGENFWILKNPALENFEGLDKLDTVKNYMLVDNNGITTLTGLDSLKHVGNNITVINNPNLVSFEGLSGLKYAKYLSIGHNDSLTSLSGLDNITEIENDISIYNNPILTSLSGLEVLNVSTLNNLGLTDNPMLSHCAIHWVCDYIEERIGNIYGNAPGCQSGLEIRQICLVSTEDISPALNISIHPNPVQDVLFISPGEGMQIIVSNPEGVVQLNEVAFGKLDVSALSPGLYVLHLQNSNLHTAFKFIKI